MNEGVYRVVVTREAGHWLADVPGLAGAYTYARSLPALDQAVREVVVLAADLPDEAVPAGHWSTTITLVMKIWMPRRWRYGSCAGRLTSSPPLPRPARARPLRSLSPGLSVRDVAALLGISPQRVSQLTVRAS